MLNIILLLLLFTGICFPFFMSYRALKQIQKPKQPFVIKMSYYSNLKFFYSYVGWWHIQQCTHAPSSVHTSTSSPSAVRDANVLNLPGNGFESRLVYLLFNNGWVQSWFCLLGSHVPGMLCDVTTESALV